MGYFLLKVKLLDGEQRHKENTGRWVSYHAAVAPASQLPSATGLSEG